jgi:hypothetical protein
MSANSAAHLLLDLRAGGDAMQAAQEILVADAAIRAEVTRLLAGSVTPADHALARWLLRVETEALATAGSGESEALYTLVALVARFADPRDALLIWRARQATSETQTGVDMEQLARLGLDGVRRYLSRLRDENGPEALWRWPGWTRANATAPSAIWLAISRGQTSASASPSLAPPDGLSVPGRGTNRAAASK